MKTGVLRIEDIALPKLVALLARYGLKVVQVEAGAPIPGSFWGEPEAGLILDALYLRDDTPVHSALHEASHWICMDEERRAKLHTNAGGNVEEECAVNFLQILLAEQLPDVGRARMLDDMDRWGYSYREGNVRAWLAGDGQEALAWLVQRELARADGQLIYPK